MGVLLGLVVAITYGTGDFFGGLAARRVPVLWVVFLSHALAAVLVVAIVGLDHNSHPTREDIVIGIVAGIVGMVSVALFYRGLAIGRMGMVAPITAVVSAIVPVTWGLTFGERPSALALVGVALAVGSVALISSEAGDSPHEPVSRSRTPLYLALGAGLGFGAFFVLYSNAGARSGMWPLLASRWTSASLLALVFAFVPRARRDPPSRKPSLSSPAQGCSTPQRTASSWPRPAPACSRSSAPSARSTRRARCCSRGVCSMNASTARRSSDSPSRPWASY